MSDEGFNIKDLLEPNGATLNNYNSLSFRLNQANEEEVKIRHRQ